MPALAALTNGSPHSWIILRALVARFGPVTVLVEEKEPRGALLRRRIRRQGLLRVAGQLGFVALQRALAGRARRRIREILESRGLDPRPHPDCEVVPVGSVNSEACRAALVRVKPDVVIVFGTRILRRETLQALAALGAPVMNLHSGITPKYRGQAGGYWALAMGDPEHAGITIHLVDEGVDTGAVIAQAPFRPEPGDSFPTYFYLQADAFRPLVVQAVEDALQGRLRTWDPGLPSAQYFHPTLWGYLWTGLRRGVW